MKIKNWHKFQHFTTRKPPWIKLYRDILDDVDINLISDGSFRILVGLWLLASEDDEQQGNLPDLKSISFRLRVEKSKLLKALKELENFLIQDDITVISERYQNDALEKETEKETENKKICPPPKKTGRQKFTPPTLQEVSDYCKANDLNLDPNAFWHYYNDGEWKDAKGKPVLSYKQKMRTWSTKNDEQGKNYRNSVAEPPKMTDDEIREKIRQNDEKRRSL